MGLTATETRETRREPRAVAAVHWLFESHRLPAFMLAVVVLYKVLLLAVLAVPQSSSALGQFAEEFKTWCFGYDPATGRLQWMYVITMVAEPLVFGVAIFLFWGRSLRQVVRRAPRTLLPSGIAALGVVGLAAGGFGLMRTAGAADAELPFPAEALRVSHAAPALRLVDQDGATVALDELRGKVVMLTGVYASCGFTCPMIMGQAKRAVDSLPERDRQDVVVVGVTLDPENDDRERLAAMALGQHVGAPTFHLVTGPAGEVHRVLDALEIQRKRDPGTGIIDHANLFILVDRTGRVAYRFTLGDRQERWLSTALALLVRERDG
jgi:protein SCO1/2